MVKRHLHTCSVLLCLVAVGCSSKAQSAAAGGDAGSGQPDGGGHPLEGGAGDGGGFVPAFKPDVGQIVSAGGKLIAAPRLVTVTWDGDPNRAALEDFGDKLTVSGYWKSTTAEYGIGQGTSGAANHLHLAGAPPGRDPSDISAYLRAQLAAAAPTDGGAPSGWPVPDDSTTYVVYIPRSAKMNPSTTKHSELTVGSMHVPYVLVDEGGAVAGQSDVDFATAGAGHEIAEVATNPHLSTDPAFGEFDALHLAWKALSQDNEIGDICELYPDAEYRGAGDLPYNLQRLWSNKSAAAGLNPCVPAPSEPYYNVAPLGLENVSVFMGAAVSPVSGYGYQVPIGGNKAIKLGFFSSLPSAAWTITATEGNWFSPASNKRLTIVVDKGTGNNGDVGQITVTANAKAPGDGNAVVVTITSKAPGLPEHSMPLLIGTYP